MDIQRLVARSDDCSGILRLDETPRRQLGRIGFVLVIEMALIPLVTETKWTASPLARNFAAVPPTLSSLSSGCAPMQRIDRFDIRSPPRPIGI